MTLFLLLSCGSGSTKAEDPQSRFLKSVISLGNDFLNVFTSLSDMVGGVLGFNTNTKKSDVAAYFKTVHDTVSSTKTSLEKIVADMKSDNNPNSEATDTAVKALITNTLDKIIDGAKTASEAIGSDASDSLANVAAANAAGVAGTGVDKLINGIKSIVDVVLKDVGNADAGDNKKAEELNVRNNDGAGKLFDGSTGAAGDDKKAAADAAKAVGAVTGADILKAMVKDNGDAAKLAKNSAAIAGVAANAKDGTIAGGIALRAMAKDGKFANGNNANDAKKTIEGAATSAVTKALGTLTIAIRNTIDVGLKEVKDAMKFNSIDTPVTTDRQFSETKGQ
ncbi:variable large family protein (plasmid) [Borrelia parkeri]|nr:variable large family protein [Borrelia parkeri]UPA11496.1 variable large family protein [Borrelia parkeri]UPA11584.1 variable large family protein [Borrelia parkeri]UPA11637.1 variable large family protein [Borrelia parkeri]